MTTGARILIVDDHASVRDGVRAFIESKSDFTICGEAENGTAAIQQAKLLKPDVIILDLALPMLNGFEAASVLRRELPNVKIVAFTMFADELGHAIRSATRIDAVVPKSSALKKLVETIQTLLRQPLTPAPPTPPPDWSPAGI